MSGKLIHAQSVADFTLRRLHDWGIRRVFGYPGDGINGLMGAFTRFDGLEFIQVRHEEMAAFMACAHAKFTGRPGVCMATSGPGAIHLLNGLYDAKMDHQPVVAIVGQQDTLAMGSEYQQEVDLNTLFKDVAGAYVTTVMSAGAVRHCLDRALRIATAHRTVTCVIIPKDLQEDKAQPSPPRRHGASFSGVGFNPPKVVPRDQDLRRAADVLNAGQRVAMLVGAGALEAGPEIKQVADLLGAGVAKALLGKAALPDDLAYVTGPIGLLGTKPSWDLMMNCDTLLVVGSAFPYAEFLPPEGQARGVQVDLEPGRISLRYPMEVGLCGDSADTLRALAPMLKRKTDRAWRAEVERNVAQWWITTEGQAKVSANPLNPQLVFWELSPRLPDNVILTSDSGSAANWWARDLKIREGMMASLSGNLATMCPGVPYAIAAKFAYPDRPVIAAVGDGAMQMLGINGLITISKYWKQWKDPRLVVLVLNNHDLNQVTWEQRIMAGDPRFAGSQDIPDMPYAGYAELLGLNGVTMASPAEVVPGWERALRSDRPVVVEARVDPEVPPLPPHITLDQAKGFLGAVLRGDSGAGAFVKQSAKAMAENLATRSRGKS